MGPDKRMALNSLTGLRAVAAFAVFGYHLQWMIPGVRQGGADGLAAILDRVLIRGYIGVSFFFVLSGFVLAWSRPRHEAPARFWRKRAARLLPNHAVTWLLAGVFIVNGAVAAPPVAAAVANLLLLPHVFVPGADWTVMNNPSWSIEVEAFFYLMFPFVMARVGRLRDRQVMATVAAAGALVLGLPALALAGGVGDTEGVWRLLYFFPLVRLPEFVVGVALGELAVRGRTPSIDPRWAWLAVVAGFVVCITVAPVVFTFAAVMLGPFVVLILAYADADRAGAVTQLGGRFWVHLGAVSYAFYAGHDLVIRAFEGFVTGPLTIGVAVAVALGSFAGALAGAEALHRLVERPAMSWFRRQSRPAPAT